MIETHTVIEITNDHSKNVCDHFSSISWLLRDFIVILLGDYLYYCLHFTIELKFRSPPILTMNATKFRRTGKTVCDNCVKRASAAISQYWCDYNQFSPCSPSAFELHEIQSISKETSFILWNGIRLQFDNYRGKCEMISRNIIFIDEIKLFCNKESANNFVECILRCSFLAADYYFKSICHCAGKHLSLGRFTTIFCFDGIYAHVWL